MKRCTFEHLTFTR